MDQTGELHVVVGATGGTGSALLRELVLRRKRAVAVSRSGRAVVPEGVEVLAGDATDGPRMREVCRGATVVYNCVNPPFTRWEEDFPRIMESTIEATEAAGAKYVFADDTWMYGRVRGPMTEDTPHRPVSRKGALRARLAETLLDAHASGRVRAVIGRGAELYGPGVESVLGANLFAAAVKGKRAMWIGDLDLPLTPLFIEDFARGLATLGEREEALGEVWHIPTAGTVTGRQFVRMVYEAAGARFRVRAVGSRTVRLLGLFLPLARQGAELVYQFEQPFVVDSAKFEQAFGASPTPHPEAVRRTYEWYRGKPAVETDRPWWREVLGYGHPSR